MKAPPFSYHAPRSLSEAMELLARLDNPRLLAGGQSLMPMLNFRVAAPDHLIDLMHVEELRGIVPTKDGLSIGAMTTQRTVENSALVTECCPLLARALLHVGHQTTRNRGTIGGSLCHLDPAAELPLVSQVLEPVLTCSSNRGTRRIGFADFPVDQLTTQLEPDEILVRLDFKRQGANSYCGFEEFARRPGDFAIAAVAVLVAFGDNGTTSDARVTDARIAVSGIAPVAMRMPEAEQILLGHVLIGERLVKAAEAVGAYPAQGDKNNPAVYRQHLAKVLTRRALETAHASRMEALDA